MKRKQKTKEENNIKENYVYVYKTYKINNIYTRMWRKENEIKEMLFSFYIFIMIFTVMKKLEIL